MTAVDINWQQRKRGDSGFYSPTVLPVEVAPPVALPPATVPGVVVGVSVALFKLDPSPAVWGPEE